MATTRSKSRMYVMALVITGLILLSTGRGLGDILERLPGRGAVIPAFSLPSPPSQADKSYLLIKEEERFQPAEIKVKLLLIEVLNVYCASCQIMRPYLNELYSKIELDPELKGQVKMMGISAGNDHWDIEVVEDSYDFPLVPDNKYKFHDLVGQPPTPFLIFARPYGQGQLLVVNSHLGKLQDSDKLLSMTREAFNTDTSEIEIIFPEKQKHKAKAELEIPISDDELLKRVRDSLTVRGDKLLVEIEKITFADLGRVYIGTLMNSKKRVFARVVARKIPCIDCDDQFYIYSFNDEGEFLQFVPISVSKLYNEKWNEDDLNKIRNRFKNTSLLKEIHFNTEIDAVTSATISSRIIYDSLNETKLVFEQLIDLGYIEK